MTAKSLYRISAVLFLLFALGHTIGFLTLKPPTAEAQAVFASMNEVHFQVRNSAYSYGGFYKGFGLSITASMLFCAILAWQLSNVTATSQAASLGWTFCALQLVSLVLAVKYFSILPAIFSAVLAICLAWAAWSAQRSPETRTV